MKKIYRDIPLEKYWTNRWDEFEGDKNTFEREDIYPIAYSDKALKTFGALNPNVRPKILECGVGLGRVLKHYHNRGYDIHGFDNNALAIKKVRKSDRKLNIVKADVKRLPYKDETFDVAFAFGVFHNVEEGLGKAIDNVMKCVKKDGVVCFSFSAQNIGTWLREIGYQRGHFYKWHFTEKDIHNIAPTCGILPVCIKTIQNIPILFRYKIFRKSKSEGENRTKGYKLNRLGETINGLLFRLFPKSFGDTVILIGIRNIGA